MIINAVAWDKLKSKIKHDIKAYDSAIKKAGHVKDFQTVLSLQSEKEGMEHVLNSLMIQIEKE